MVWLWRKVNARQNLFPQMRWDSCLCFKSMWCSSLSPFFADKALYVGVMLPFRACHVVTAAHMVGNQSIAGWAMGSGAVEEHGVQSTMLLAQPGNGVLPEALMSQSWTTGAQPVWWSGKCPQTRDGGKTLDSHCRGRWVLGNALVRAFATLLRSHK